MPQNLWIDATNNLASTARILVLVILFSLLGQSSSFGAPLKADQVCKRDFLAEVEKVNTPFSEVLVYPPAISAKWQKIIDHFHSRILNWRPSLEHEPSDRALKRLHTALTQVLHLMEDLQTQGNLYPAEVQESEKGLKSRVQFASRFVSGVLENMETGSMRASFFSFVAFWEKSLVIRLNSAFLNALIDLGALTPGQRIAAPSGHSLPLWATERYVPEKREILHIIGRKPNASFSERQLLLTEEIRRLILLAKWVMAENLETQLQIKVLPPFPLHPEEIQRFYQAISKVSAGIKFSI